MKREMKRKMRCHRFETILQDHFFSYDFADNKASKQAYIMVYMYLL